MHESEFIEWICRQKEFDPSVVPVGPGDDCAVIISDGQKLLVTTDQLLDGVHFSLALDGPFAVGRKAMARALSDIAAMAALPLGAVASVALPKGFSRADAEELYRGMRSASDEFACPMVGGDVAGWSGPMAVGVTVFGRPEGVEPVLRSGAVANDAVCVTGRFGGAWKTGRHLSFTPRIHEARRLAAEFDIHAMIDVSDGLARDLHHACDASGVGAEVFAEQVPTHPDAPAGREDITPLDAALNDGEDYELLFTLPEVRSDELLRVQPFDVEVTRIGTITAGAGVWLICPDTSRRQLPPGGWEHET